MRSIRSELKGSRFPLKLGLPPAPVWKRRLPAVTSGVQRDSAPAETRPADRVRRSERLDSDAVKRGEMAHLSSDKGES